MPIGLLRIAMSPDLMSASGHDDDDRLLYATGGRTIEIGSGFHHGTFVEEGHANDADDDATILPYDAFEALVAVVSALLAATSQDDT